MDQRTVISAAVLGKDHRPGLGIEIGEQVVLLERRRGVLVSEADIGGQLRRDAIVVLNEVELHVLPLIHDGVARERQLGRQAEEQIGNGPIREAVFEVHAPDSCVQIVDAGLDVQELSAELDEVRAAIQAERRAGIPRPWCLELRCRGMPSDSIEPLDIHLGNTAHDRRVARHAAQANLGWRRRRRSSADRCSSRRARSRSGCPRRGGTRPPRSVRAPGLASDCHSPQTRR